MNIGWNLETYISIISFIITIVALFFIIRIDWKKYGLLFIISSIVGVIICFIFIGLNFYEFPYRLFPGISKIPFTAILTVFPFYVLLGVRYSPKLWSWKIPFYWVLVHIGMFAETWAESHTQLIKYLSPWDVWDSYTWWWIYLLVFEWLGGLIIPPEKRKPLNHELLRSGTIGWFILHFILIATIFLAGVYTGMYLK
jgi:hypothetical protein